MTKTYSKPEQDWEGFRPVRYFLRNYWQTPIQQIRATEDGEQTVDTTIGKGLTFVLAQGIEEIEWRAGGVKIRTKTGTVRFAGKPFHCDLLRALVDLERKGVNSYEASWFYFDEDHCSDDLMRSFGFFVLANDIIVSERVRFTDHSDSGFDPRIFEPYDPAGLWRNDRDWEAAYVSAMYKKFYADTETGRLMVLRPDQPQIFFFERENKAFEDIQAVMLARAYRLLTVIVPLVAAVALREYCMIFVIIAAVLFVDFLMLCWRTRHAGNS